MPEHALELRVTQQVEDPRRSAHRRGLRRAADRERVRHGGLCDRDAGLGQVRLNAQALDDRVQTVGLRRVVWAYGARAHREQRDLVRGEELKQEQKPRDHRDRDRAGPRRDKDAHQDRVNQPQQEQCQSHPGLESAVATEYIFTSHNGNNVRRRA